MIRNIRLFLRFCKSNKDDVPIPNKNDKNTNLKGLKRPISFNEMKKPIPKLSLK